jgi:hypothetical protein
MNQKESEKIKSLKDEIHHLKEYLVSDCCKKCFEIVSKIEAYQKEIEKIHSSINL